MAFTYFFRDMQTLEAVRDHVVPHLISRRYIHIWDAGCAMGPEPYSLAMMLRENMGYMIFRNITIHATDIDESQLFGKTIREGIYPLEQLKRIPSDIFSRYFQKMDHDDHFRVIEEIRKCVTYKRHNLLTLEPIRNELGLIMCKNVLLHFKEHERVEVIKMFYHALSDDGFFVTEQTQILPEPVKNMFEQVVSNVRLYRKRKTTP